MKRIIYILLFLVSFTNVNGQQYGMPIGVGAVAAATTTTWDPAQKAASITLSNGNLTATQASGGWNGTKGLSSLAKASGKWYFEVTVVSNTSNLIIVGVANSGASLTAFCGSDVNGWGYYAGTGQIYTGGGNFPGGSTFTNGDVIGVCIDATLKRAWFAKNNTYILSGAPATNTNPSFTGLTGSLMPMISINSAGSVVANFGAVAFTYTPPSGFVAIQ